MKFTRKTLAAALASLLVILVLAPHLVSLVGQWPDRHSDYERSIAGMERVYAIPARFAAQNTPKNAVIAVGLGGAASYITDRPIIELTGAQQPQNFGRPGYDIIARQKPGYFITFPDDRYAMSIPGAVNIAAGKIDSPMMVVKLDWSWQPSDNTTPYLVTDGYTVTDQFAPADKAGADAHGYRGGNVVYAPFVASLLPSGQAIIEQGFLQRTPDDEEFTMTATKAKPARLLLRYDAVIGGNADVFVDGAKVGTWNLPEGKYALNEAAFDIPAEFVAGDTINVKLEWKTDVSTFHYWLLGGD